MVVLYHYNSKVRQVTVDAQSIPFDSQSTIADSLHALAQQFPDKKIVWCTIEVKQELNLEIIPLLFHHNKMMLSYACDTRNFFDSKIGYVEESLFININKKVTFPTWQMSSRVGVIAASFLNVIKEEVPKEADFDYYLNAIAKLAMPKGLLCYSEPKLLKSEISVISKKASIFSLFRFVKQHYKTRWVFLLFFNLMIYERKFFIFPLLYSLFYKNRKEKKINLEAIEVQSSKTVSNQGTLDVIIPTIGRANYLHNVLIDFSKQSLLPDKIIIVEQNPEQDSKSELAYLYDEKWPFTIQHFFIHQAGACNARNLALAHTQSEWVFLADDDNRFEPNLIEEVFFNIKKYGTEVATVSYPQKNENKVYLHPLQWLSFGAGNSFVKKNVLESIRFNTAFEFGYGEDSDFGMQLRNQGNDVLYLPYPEILHLKAPVGGFRTKPKLLWQEEAIQPKPSPTVMLYQIIHNSKEQILGYKTVLFFKYYKHQNSKNPYRYFVYFQKQWRQSVYWAHQLKIKS